jgi:hypothetical protein
MMSNIFIVISSACFFENASVIRFEFSLQHGGIQSHKSKVNVPDAGFHLNSVIETRPCFKCMPYQFLFLLSIREINPVRRNLLDSKKKNNKSLREE